MTTGDEARGHDTGASAGFWWAVLGVGGSLIVVLVIGAIILGAGPGDSDSDDLLTLGEKVYGRTCVSCHGPEGEGGVGPSFTGVVERLPDVGEHTEIVRTGRGTMPSFGPLLTDAEIEAVVAYEREVLDAG